MPSSQRPVHDGAPAAPPTELERAERAARERLDELESLYRNAPVGLAFMDRDLRYLRVNQTIADANGVPIEEMLGKSYRDLSPETADAAEPFLRRIMARGEGIRNLEVRASPPSDPGVEHVYLLSMEPVRNEAQGVVRYVSAVQDITELRRAEATAAGRLRELETLYANTPVGLCYMDPDLRIVHLNPLFAAIGNRPLEEQIGATAPEVLQEEIASALVPELRYVARTGRDSRQIQVRGRLPRCGSREYTWLVHTHAVRSDAGELAGLVTVLQDVSVLSERLREIEVTRDRLVEAQGVARLGSWEWNLLEDKVWWSPALYEIFGERRRFEPSYVGFFEYVHPDDRREVRRQLEQALAGDKPYRASFRIVRRDGSVRELFSAARLECTPSGHPARLVGTCLDVTEFEPPRTRRSRAFAPQ